ncbi:MAG: hypothetical protein JSU73_08950 [candidate division WOR-3 bacterium]|nr:MAG: hypothetical protein JSU73_08950 [candidate division WOR-3 bacterium]
MVTLEKQGCAWWASTLSAYARTAAGAQLACIAFRSEETSCRYTPILPHMLAGVAPMFAAVIVYNISASCLSPRCC